MRSGPGGPGFPAAGAAAVPFRVMDASERLEERTTRLTGATERLAHNVTFVGVLPALVVGALLALVNPIVGVLAAIVLAAAWVLLVRHRINAAADVVFAGLPTRPLQPDEAPRLVNVLDGLCLTCGVDDPAVEVVDATDQPAEALNAGVAVAGGTVRLVLTPAVLVDLDRMQLEGLLANLLGRVRDGSAAHTTLVSALFGAGERSERRLDAAIGDQRAVRSDLVAVDLTRYPPGLRAALAAMAARGTSVAGAPPRSRACWIAPIEAHVGASGDDGVMNSDDGALDLRIAVLAEL